MDETRKPLREVMAEIHALLGDDMAKIDPREVIYDEWVGHPVPRWYMQLAARRRKDDMRARRAESEAS